MLFSYSKFIENICMWKEKFINYLRFERNYSSHTEAAYLKDIDQFIQFVENIHGRFAPEQVDTNIIRTWIAQLMEQKIKPRSVNRKLSALKSFYKYLNRQGVVSTNPAKKVSGPKGSKKLPTFANDIQMNSILDDTLSFPDDFEGIRDRFLLELLYVTGMRRAEVIGLQDKDIDFNNNTLRVTGKRNKQRMIPFSDTTREKMKQYIAKRDEEIVNKSYYLFVRKNGEPLYPALVYAIVKKQLNTLPTLSKKSPHVLRHSFATAMLNDGAEINSVKELLGHTSLASTEIYTHVTFEELNREYHKAHPRATKKRR